MGQAGIHPAPDRDQGEADGEEEARVDPAQRDDDQRDDEELRQSDPVQDIADLERPQALDARQIVRQDISRSLGPEAVDADQQRGNGDIHLAQHRQMNQGILTIASLTMKAMTSSSPPARQPFTTPEFSQSKRLP